MYLFALTALFASISIFPNGEDAHALASWASLFGAVALFAKRLLQPGVEPIWASVVSARVRTVILVIIAGVGPAAAALATASTWQQGLLNAAWAALVGVAGALGLDHVLPESGSQAVLDKFNLWHISKNGSPKKD